jgi:hypothetical protein
MGMGIVDVIEILNSIYNGILEASECNPVDIYIAVDKKEIKAIEVETTENAAGTKAYRINMRSEKE